jgi:uncharacterized alpha-E superfamily protein
VAEFLLLNADFPHSVRFSIDKVHECLLTIGELTERKGGSPMRLSGRMRANLSFSQIDEIMAGGLSEYLAEIRSQCAQLHTAIHQIYFDYPIEAAMAS